MCVYVYLKTGIDSDGHVANYVECENVLIINKQKLITYNLLRGSVPTYWGQKGSIKKHIELEDTKLLSKQAFKKHFTQL